MSDFPLDRSSGSSDVALAFLTHLERWIAIDTSTSAAELRRSLLVWLRAAQAAQPTMALVHQLAARALDVASAGARRGDPPVELRAHLARSCQSEREDLAAARAGVARTAASLLRERGAWLATLSSSATVREAILAAKRAGREPRVLVAEGRPLLEGRALAESLAAAGVPVWLVVDAALPLLLSQAALVWLGADAVTETGLINKVGSF